MTTSQPHVFRAPDGAQFSATEFGGHVCSWIPAGGKEQLFLSKTSELGSGVAIRGGVPVVFPQFAGMGSLPNMVLRVLQIGVSYIAV